MALLPEIDRVAKSPSAGILLYHWEKNVLQLFLVHPGGPFWKNKDEGAWTIPKGEFGEHEDPLEAAFRELEEETGFRLRGKAISLGHTIQRGGKKVFAWALEAEIDASKIKSNLFELDWPPRSGKKQQFPEIDRAAWFTVEVARQKINPSQALFIDELVRLLE